MFQAYLGFQLSDRCYISSHNLIDGILEKYSNAFSIIVPGLSQIGVLARVDRSAVEHQRLDKWTMTPDGMSCNFETCPPY